MFDALNIRNFRSIEDSGVLTLSGLNVLVGPNNSGKSSILSVLLLLKQTLLDKDRGNVLVTSGPLVDLGSYLDVVGADPESVPLEVTLKLNRKDLANFPMFSFGADEEDQQPPHFDYWRFAFLYNKKANEVFVQSFSLKDSVGGQEISGERRGINWSFTGVPESLLPHLRLEFQHFLPLFRPVGPKPEEKIAEDATRFYMNLYMSISSLGWYFEKLSYVGPVREKIPRYGVLGTMPYSEMGPSGQNLMRVLSTTHRRRSRKLPITQLNHWLDKKFHMLTKVRVKNIDTGGTVRALIADDHSGGAKVNLAATGAGISQIVPVVLQTLLTAPGGCLIVEQPEIHLHPAAQTTLADLFIEHLSQRRQYIIETHSEHFVLRVRRRMAEGKLLPTDVRILFVEKIQGRTKIRQPELSDRGNFIEWPKDFFEEAYDEALALAEASTRRK